MMIHLPGCFGTKISEHFHSSFLIVDIVGFALCKNILLSWQNSRFVADSCGVISSLQTTERYIGIWRVS